MNHRYQNLGRTAVWGLSYASVEWKKNEVSNLLKFATKDSSSNELQSFRSWVNIFISYFRDNFFKKNGQAFVSQKNEGGRPSRVDFRPEKLQKQ